MNYKIIAKDGRAKRAEVSTVHGTIQTPVFMNVGTVGAIKGAVSTDDLKEIIRFCGHSAAGGASGRGEKSTGVG